MKHFALIFRQHPTQLSEADQKRRSQEVREWALRQNSEDHKLDPRLLDQDGQRVEPKTNRGSTANGDDGKLVAVTILEAHDIVAKRLQLRSHIPAVTTASVSKSVRGHRRPGRRRRRGHNSEKSLLRKRRTGNKRRPAVSESVVVTTAAIGHHWDAIGYIHVA